MAAVSAPPAALTIAGSDSSGGAGIQADLKTFSALGVYGASVITALTAQNTLGVTAIHYSPADFLLAQMNAVFSDLNIRAVKIGMIGNADNAHAIAQGLAGKTALRIVLDPVMVATSGAVLLEADAEEALKRQLIPLASIITPNGREAARLLGEELADCEEVRERQAMALFDLGARSVLLTGGEGSGAQAVDLFYDGSSLQRLSAPRIATANTHGTGCTLSSAIAAYLAHGQDLFEAVRAAKGYVTGALRHADGLHVGKGAGPVHHFYALWNGKTPQV